VLSESGSARTQAVILLRTAGAQFLELGLPEGSRLLSLAVDGSAVKPVEGGTGQVRVQLAAKADPTTNTAITLIYENRIAEWNGAGTSALLAPRLPREVPVLQSAWHLYLPDGFRYSGFDSNLSTPKETPERLLLCEPLHWFSAMGSVVGHRANSTSVDFAAPGAAPIAATPAPSAELEGHAQLQADKAAAQTNADVSKPTSAPLAKDDFSMILKGKARGPETKKAAPDEGLENAKVAKEPELSTPLANAEAVRIVGLLPIKLDLPKVGQRITLTGLMAPTHLMFR